MEFETLYKQTFAQVRCPARVAVAAAQPAPRRRFGWVICFAAPLLLAVIGAGDIEQIFHWLPGGENA